MRRVGISNGKGRCDVIELEDVPELHDPVMIVAFEGWNDAGEAATGTVEHLAEVFGAEPVAALDPEDYYDFQVNRPRVGTDDGVRRITWRTTRLLLATHTSIGRDVVLVHGVEPSFRWRAFTIELMEFASSHDIDQIILLGALLADTPHTRPVPVSATSDSPETRDRYDLTVSDYEGPTGIVGVLADAAEQVGIPAISCWAAIPHYAGHTPSPKATRALVSRLEVLFGAPISHGDLDEDSYAWERGVDDLAESDPEIAAYVEALERAQDTAELPEATGDAIAQEFERYLRRRDPGADPA